MSLRSITLLAVAAACLPAALSAEPQLGVQKFYKDWAVACDNRLSCEAVSLRNDVPDDGLSISIARDSVDGALSILLFGLESSSDRYRILVDGRAVHSGAIESSASEPIKIGGKDALRLTRLMVKGRTIIVRDGANLELGRASLAGTGAALLHIDSVQNRAGTATALATPGRKSLRPKSAPAPEIVAKRIKPTNVTPDATTLISLVESSACKEERFNVTEDVAYSLGRIDGRAKALILLSCGSGAYNFASAAYIATEISEGKWDFEPAAFDYGAMPSTMDKSLPLLVNADWDEAGQTLSSYAKGRGLGDCGNAESYVWDGARFRLISAYGMSECRGSMDWLTLWHANVKLVD
jgi:hypothetical protein